GRGKNIHIRVGGREIHHILVHQRVRHRIPNHDRLQSQLQVDKFVELQQAEEVDVEVGGEPNHRAERTVQIEFEIEIAEAQTVAGLLHRLEIDHQIVRGRVHRQIEIGSVYFHSRQANQSNEIGRSLDRNPLTACIDFVRENPEA